MAAGSRSSSAARRPAPAPLPRRRRPRPQPPPRPTAKPSKAPTPTPKATKAPTPTPKATPKARRRSPRKAPTPKPTKAPTPKPTTAPTPAPSNGLLGKTWQLTRILLNDPDIEYDIPADRQASFTITFAKNGTFSAQADCNTVNGSYTTADAAASSGDLEIVPGLEHQRGLPGRIDRRPVRARPVELVSYSITSNVLTTTTDDGGQLTLQ